MKETLDRQRKGQGTRSEENFEREIVLQVKAQKPTELKSSSYNFLFLHLSGVRITTNLKTIEKK